MNGTRAKTMEEGMLFLQRMNVAVGGVGRVADDHHLCLWVRRVATADWTTEKF